MVFEVVGLVCPMEAVVTENTCELFKIRYLAYDIKYRSKEALTFV